MLSKATQLILMLGVASFAFAAKAAPNPPIAIEAEAPDKKAQRMIDIDELSKILDLPDPSLRYLAVAEAVNEKSEWVLLGEGAIAHLSAVLITQKQHEVADALLKNNIVSGWISYPFMGGISNDFVFAMDGGDVKYIESLVAHEPSGINTPFVLTTSGGKVSPLSLLATNRYVNESHYERAIELLLENGGDPTRALPNGLSPNIIASGANNIEFVRIVREFEAQQAGERIGLLDNAPMSTDSMLEMQAITDAFLEKTKAEKASWSTARVHDLWVKMIMKGYNVPAELLYEELATREDFDINAPAGRDRDMTAMMAATLSPMRGGNVEYAVKLTERGADPQFLLSVPISEEKSIKINLIQLALKQDNFKVIAHLMREGVNFIHPPGEPDILIYEEAMEQKAYKSAYIIKKALENEIKRMSGRETSE